MPGKRLPQLAAGAGVALLAASIARAAGPRITVVELDSPVPHPPVAAIRASVGRSPAADAFVTALLAMPAGPDTPAV